MTLRLNVDKLKARIAQSDAFQTAGRLHSVREILTANVAASFGELCEIHTNSDRPLLAEVIGVNNNIAQLMTFQPATGLAPGREVIATGRNVRVPVGARLIGRTVNGLGIPIDGQGSLGATRWRSFSTEAPSPMTRPRIMSPLVTGQRVIDGLMTIGTGQRLGLFAGSGVGKSTLLGEIAKHAQSDINVIALVGERGREVMPFLEDCLGKQGRSRSVVIVATSDETALMKIQAVKTAITIAEDFRDSGANVMFFLDSLTRLATAQKEVGLARGETPGLRGYPPSVQTTIASLLERLGTSESGSITGLITVLVDGDDLDEPVADTARSILDGHIVLSRKLAAKGQYPAVDVLNSLSRVFRNVSSNEHQLAAGTIRELLAIYEEVSDLIQVGLYQPGSSEQIDQAVRTLPLIKQFLGQQIDEVSTFEETRQAMYQILGGIQTGIST